MYPFKSGLFHLAPMPFGIIMLLHISVVGSFLLQSMLMYQFVYTPDDGHLSCFPVLAIMNKITMSIHI